MKVFVYFALIGFSLLCSIIFSLKTIKNNKGPGTGIIAATAIMINIIILGSGSVWWFLTETDGFSQIIGVMIYMGSTVAISFIDILVIYKLEWIKDVIKSRV